MKRISRGYRETCPGFASFNSALPSRPNLHICCAKQCDSLEVLMTSRGRDKLPSLTKQNSWARKLTCFFLWQSCHWSTLIIFYVIAFQFCYVLNYIKSRMKLLFSGYTYSTWKVGPWQTPNYLFHSIVSRWERYLYPYIFFFPK